MSSSEHPRGDILQAYVDAELPTAKAMAVEEHCRACPGCREQMASLRALQATLALDRGHEPPQPVWPGLSARLGRERRPLGLAFAFGATVACAAGVTLGIVVGGAPAGQSRGTRPSTEATADVFWGGDRGASLLDVFATPGPEGS